MSNNGDNVDARDMALLSVRPLMETSDPTLCKGDCAMDSLRGGEDSARQLQLSSMRTDNLRRMLECIICMEYLTQATQTACCGTVFCKGCIGLWIRMYHSCPVCRKCQTVAQLTPARYVQRLALELKPDLCPSEASSDDNDAHDPLDTKDNDDDDDRRRNSSPVGVAALEPSMLRLGANLMRAHVSLFVSAHRLGYTRRPYYVRVRPRGTFTFHALETHDLLCTATRDLDDCVKILSPDQTYLARVHVRRGGNLYVATDSLERDIAALDYAPRHTVVVLPRVEHDARRDEYVVGTYTPRSRHDSLATQTRRPDAARVVHFVNSLTNERKDIRGFNAAEDDNMMWLVHASNTRALVLRPTANTTQQQQQQQYRVEFMRPVAPIQAFAIALAGIDRRRRFLKPHVAP
ncbi:Aste57867_8368 [Aphanomyces stellatus]|uniref:Aste57867_8368 protein n=1 Tax=Aphanomyces stellatus TaxID=120398 RepID=A0A485KK18_9STRA|nr:hypothetical protein As57867_008336 [Aphanomyces stellatus]VFT85254.1 Aste57867_8368 [Aphanomyces stellatus]